MRQAILGVGLMALLAPAGASASPPEASDFSQPLQGVERATSADHGAYRSEVLRAPASFDLAGLEGEQRHAELRGRVEGGEWTAWTETANGDPVWFGGMDELQVRTHGWRPSGRVHYVSVTQGTGETAAATATRGSDMPKVVSRRQWGANAKRGGCRPRQHAGYGKVKASSVHHTVSAVDYSAAQAPGMVLGICRFHRNSNGWDDIGYNALVDRFGTIYAGRAGGLGRAVVGAHTQGVNSQTSGVAVLGTHTSKPVSKSGLNGVARWLAWKLPQHDVAPTGRARLKSAGGDTARYPAGTRFRVPRIFGHRASNFTQCPGNALNDQLPKLRRKVSRKIAANGGGGVSG